MNEAKRTERKVMELREGGVWIVVKKVVDKDKYNPFRIYLKSMYHVKLIAKYADILSCVCYIREYFMEGMNAKTEKEVVDWSKKRMALY